MGRMIELLKDYWRYALLAGGGLLLLGGWYGYHVVQVRAEQTQLAQQAASQRAASSEKAAVSRTSSAPASKGGYVYIAGAVHHPGLYHVDGRTRWADVVQAAGGLTKDADGGAVNLAKVAHDEENLAVPTRGASNATAPVAAGTGAAGSAQPTSSAQAGGTTGGQVNLNSATVDQLQTISGVGPKRAQDILAYRDAHGGFKKVADLKEVSGIGDKMFASIEPHVMVGP